MGTAFSLIRAWADAGAQIKPTDAKIDQGWLAGEQPPCEYENERMYTRDTRINQIISYLNAGVPLSDIISGSVTLNDSSFKIQSSSLSDQYTKLDNFDLEAQSGSLSANTYRRAQVSGWGVSYTRGSAVRGDSISSVVNDNVRHIDISVFTWSLSGGYYSTNVTRDTGLKWEPGLLEDFPIYSAAITGNDGTGTVVNTIGVSRFNYRNVAGQCQIQGVFVPDTGINPNTLANLTLVIRSFESPF